MRVWSGFYLKFKGKFPYHPDSELMRMRTVFNLTADGSSRMIKIKDTRGGRVNVVIVDRGTVRQLISSKPGEPVEFEAPHLSSYTMHVRAATAATARVAAPAATHPTPSGAHPSAVTDSSACVAGPLLRCGRQRHAAPGRGRLGRRAGPLRRPPRPADGAG